MQLNITLVGKWKISNEVEIHSKIETVISNDKEATQIFNSFFLNIVPNLKFSPKENYVVELGNDNEPMLNYINRNSPPEVFLKNGDLKIFSKFTGEHPYRSAVSVKLRSNFIEIALPHGSSLVNLLHIFRAPFYKSSSGGLLLY